MKLRNIVTVGVATAALLALSHLAVAQNQDQPNLPVVPPNPGMSGQGGSSNDATLEIAPQPGLVAPKPAVREIPSDRNFNPGEENSSVDSNFRPRTDNGTGDLDNSLSNQGNSEGYRPHARPYLGITVAYRSMCFNGGEEHGLEVLTVDPNSPAAQAGIHAQSGVSAVGAAVTTLSALLPGGTLLANKALESSGAMGQYGDLIVAIDDKRVRDQSDLEAAMAQLKPGDTMYLTVIRANGMHETGPHPPAMKIAVRVGAVGEPVANAGGSGYLH
jgi:hypothetical protein